MLNANSVDTDQTLRFRSVWSESTLFACPSYRTLGTNELIILTYSNECLYQWLVCKHATFQHYIAPSCKHIEGTEQWTNIWHIQNRYIYVQPIKPNVRTMSLVCRRDVTSSRNDILATLCICWDITFVRGDWSWNIFYNHSLPSADSRRTVVSFWRKNVHNTG